MRPLLPADTGPEYVPSGPYGQREVNEACGVVGIHGLDGEVANQTYFALFAVQHRGQESAGISIANGQQLHEHAGMGLVSKVFTEEALDALPGHIAVGHCRYSTTGSSSTENIQPILRHPPDGIGTAGCESLSGIGSVAIAHNGNIVNALELRSHPSLHEHAGLVTSDTAVVAELIAHADGATLEERVVQVVPLLRGSFSFVISGVDRLIGARGGLGNRPLAMARLGDGWMLASETCAFDTVGATFVRDVEPGEMSRHRRRRGTFHPVGAVEAPRHVRLRTDLLPAPRLTHRRSAHPFRAPPDGPHARRATAH